MGHGLHLLTNVPAQEAGQGNLVVVYGKRWTIETAFFELTTTLSCEIQDLRVSQSRAICVLPGVGRVQRRRGHQSGVTRAHGKPQGNDDVSSYYLALEIRQTYDGMMVAIPAPHWEVFREMSPAELAGVLATRGGGQAREIPQTSTRSQKETARQNSL